MDITTVNVIYFVIGGLAGSVLTIGVQFVFKKKVDSNKVNQTGNIVYGPQAGRDIK